VDGTHILTSSTDGMTRLWDTAGPCKASYTGNTNLLTDDVLSPNGGRYLLTVEEDISYSASRFKPRADPKIYLWQLPANLRWFDRRDYGDGVSHVSYVRTAQSDAGRTELDTPLVTFTISEDATRHCSSIRKAVFSPDGMRILTIAGQCSQLR